MLGTVLLLGIEDVKDILHNLMAAASAPTQGVSP